MRRISLFLAVLAAACVYSQEAPDTFGKTEDQILAMGRKKWDEFYLAKAGESTAAMSEMNSIYGEALKHKNLKRMRRVAHSTQVAIRKLRDLMNSYGEAAIDVAENESGGGTMWIPVYAGVEADVEEVLAGVLGDDVPQAKRAVVSDVTKALDKVSASISQIHADKSATYFKYPEATASLVKMREGFAKIVVLAKGQERADSDRILGFCRDYAKTAQGNEELVSK